MLGRKTESNSLAVQCNAAQDNWFLLLLPESRSDSKGSAGPAGLPRLYFELSGPEAGPPVVLLHGWGSSAELMRPIARMVDDKCRVLNVDLPGHGHTPAPDHAIGVEDCGGLIADLIRTECVPPVTVIGHSNGGRIALYMAADDRYKSLFQRLVLISPSGIRPRRKMKTRIKSWIARLLKAPFVILPGGLRAAGLQWLRDSVVWRMLGSSDYRALSGVMRETFVRTVNHHLDDRVASVAIPTLIFRGDRDADVSQRQVNILESLIPDAGVVTLSGAGHYGYIDDPATVRAATRHFLALDRNVTS